MKCIFIALAACRMQHATCSKHATACLHRHRLPVATRIDSTQLVWQLPTRRIKQTIGNLLHKRIAQGVHEFLSIVNVSLAQSEHWESMCVCVWD